MGHLRARPRGASAGVRQGRATLGCVYRVNLDAMRPIPRRSQKAVAVATTRPTPRHQRDRRAAAGKGRQKGPRARGEEKKKPLATKRRPRPEEHDRKVGRAARRRADCPGAHLSNAHPSTSVRGPDSAPVWRLGGGFYFINLLRAMNSASIRAHGADQRSRARTNLSDPGSTGSTGHAHGARVRRRAREHLPSSGIPRPPS